MIWATLDSIVRRNLLERGYPSHYYIEALTHGATCLRQLTQDTLKVLNTVSLAVDTSDYTADLPDDFVDDIGLAIPAGGLLLPIPKRSNLNTIPAVNSDTGQFTSYPTLNESGNTFFFGFGWTWFWNFNDWGEPTGRYFGANGGDALNGYTIVRERRKIQLTASFLGASLVLTYVSDGQSADAATQIDTRAIDAIKTYINWQMSPNATVDRSPEGNTFRNEKARLRRLVDDITVTDIKQIFRANYTASPKN